VRKLLICVGKFFVATAAICALGASFFIFFSPVSGHGVTGVMFRDSGTVADVFSRQQSWYEAQGLWGILILVLFSGLYLLAVRTAWRGDHVALAIMSVTAVALSVIAGFSIGAAYLPAALGLFIGTLMFLSTRLLPER
jgi:hypothetical protein